MLQKEIDFLAISNDGVTYAILGTMELLHSAIAIVSYHKFCARASRAKSDDDNDDAGAVNSRVRRSHDRYHEYGRANFLSPFIMLCHANRIDARSFVLKRSRRFAHHVCSPFCTAIGRNPRAFAAAAAGLASDLSSSSSYLRRGRPLYR